MADFSKFYPLLLAVEGGYADDPRDSGGETYCGIARTFWPKWPGWVLVDNAKRSNPGKFGPGEYKLNRKFSLDVLFKNASLAAEVERFYRANFWRPLLLDKVSNQSAANQIADHGVNANPDRAAYLVQWCLREFFGGTQYVAPGTTEPAYCRDLALDGQLGPRSVAALNAATAANFFARYRDTREEFYRYRAGQVLRPSDPPARAAYLLRLHQFFREKLRYYPGQNVPADHLASWLGRINAIKFSA